MKKSHLLLAFIAGLLLTGCGAESALRKADGFYALGEYNEAAVYYKKAYNSTKPKDKTRRAQESFMMGECYRRINNNAKAIGAYQNAIRYRYPDSISHLHLAALQVQAGDYFLYFGRISREKGVGIGKAAYRALP